MSQSVRIAEMIAIIGSTFVGGEHLVPSRMQDRALAWCHISPPWCNQAHSKCDLGAIVSISALTIGVLQETVPPSRLPASWKVLFNRGKTRGPAVALFAGLNYVYVAYSSFQSGGGWMGFAVAGLLTLAIVPWTVLVMSGVNGKLMDAADAVPRQNLEAKEVQWLMGRWSLLNAVRGLLPLIGGVVGLWNAMR